MSVLRFFHRGYKLVRNVGLVMLGATGVLFSFVAAKVFGIGAIGALGGDDAFADAPYAQSSYGDAGGGDSGCCSDGGDSCG